MELGVAYKWVSSRGLNMKAFFAMFLFMAISVVLFERAKAAPLPLPQNIAGMSSSIVKKVHHACVPSKCWCASSGLRTCTRDCRRDRHCRWRPSTKSICGAEWKCRIVPLSGKKSCNRCNEQALRKYRACKVGPADLVKRRNCKARYANDKNRCKILHCLKR